VIEKKYSVPAISCEHCRRAIEGALGGMECVDQVSVDVADKSVAVTFGEADCEEAVKARLADEGYPVEPES
jgi:copper chaperone CopZ